MKKISTILALVMVMALAVPVLAAEEEAAKAEITGGSVEFTSDIFSSTTDKEAGPNESDIKTGNTANMSGGDHEVTAEFSGMAFKGLDWTFDMELNGDEDAAAGLALSKSTDTAEVEVSTDINFADNRTVANAYSYEYILVSNANGTVAYQGEKDIDDDGNLEDVTVKDLDGDGFHGDAGDAMQATMPNEGLWDSINDNVELRAKKTVGKVEVQAKAGLGSAITRVQDDGTYIKYNFTDDLSATFKPYEAGFAIGDEFEVDPGGLAGVEASYAMGDLSLDGALHMSGTTKENYDENPTLVGVQGEEGSEMSSRQMRLKAAGTYDMGDAGSATVGALLNTKSYGFTDDKNDDDEYTENGLLEENDDFRVVVNDTRYAFGVLPDDATGVDADKLQEVVIPELNYALNADATYNLTEALTLNGEFLYGNGAYKVEETNVNADLARTDLGMYAKATMDLDVAEVYGSYKLDKTTVTENEAADGMLEEAVKTTNTITAGVEKELEDGVTVNAEFTSEPSTTDYTFKGDAVEDQTVESTSTSLTTKVSYSF